MPFDIPLDERFRRAYAVLEARAGRWIIPIYGINREGLLQPAGSGVLIRYKREYYLVSAGHVFDEVRHSMLYTYGGSEHGFVPLRGSEGLTTLPSGFLRGDDKLDIGAMNLDRAFARQLESADAEFASVDVFWTGDLLEGAYAFMGYPAQTNTPVYEESGASISIPRRFMSFRITRAPESRYSVVGCSPEDHLVAVFNHRRLFSELGTHERELEPRGISGGAVVYHGTLDAVLSGYATPRIVGVGVEYHEGEYLMVATRSVIVLEILRQLRERLGLQSA